MIMQIKLCGSCINVPKSFIASFCLQIKTQNFLFNHYIYKFNLNIPYHKWNYD